MFFSEGSCAFSRSHVSLGIVGSTRERESRQANKTSAGGRRHREEIMDPVERRAFMKGAAIGALAFSVGGVEVMLAPGQARAQGVPLKVLSAAEAKALEAVSETLVPGARQAGIAHFIDQQCSVPPHEALLSARIGNVPPPFANFYRAALTEIDRQCGTKHGKTFAELGAAEQREFIDLV